jgi:hypothetical protein
MWKVVSAMQRAAVPYCAPDMMIAGQPYGAGQDSGSNYDRSLARIPFAMAL